MADHTHPDDRIVIACPACVADVRQAEAEARWEQAPVRRVTWTFTYLTWDNENDQTLSFTRDVKVPDGANKWEVDDRYVGMTGEAFVMALPDTVPMDSTTYAAETCELEDVTIGPISVTDNQTPTDDRQLAMFTETP